MLISKSQRVGVLLATAIFCGCNAFVDIEDEHPVRPSSNSNSVLPNNDVSNTNNDVPPNNDVSNTNNKVPPNNDVSNTNNDGSNSNNPQSCEDVLDQISAGERDTCQGLDDACYEVCSMAFSTEFTCAEANQILTGYAPDFGELTTEEQLMLCAEYGLQIDERLDEETCFRLINECEF